jgi:D-2-hydroxyglutarate dehydrogenase
MSKDVYMRFSTYRGNFISRIRKQNFSSLCSSERHIQFFRSILGDNNVLDENHDKFRNYTIDWTKRFEGGKVVCFPETTDQVSKVLNYCNSQRIGVVPQGGL